MCVKMLQRKDSIMHTRMYVNTCHKVVVIVGYTLIACLDVFTLLAIDKDNFPFPFKLFWDKMSSNI